MPPGRLSMLLSPSRRQSQELFRKIREFAKELGGVEPAEESALRLEFHNASRIVVLPGKEASFRGFSGVRMGVDSRMIRPPETASIGLTLW